MRLADDVAQLDGTLPAGTPVRLATAAERAGEADALAEMVEAGQVTAYVVEGYGVRYLGAQSVTDAPTPTVNASPAGR